MSRAAFDMDHDIQTELNAHDDNQHSSDDEAQKRRKKGGKRKNNSLKKKLMNQLLSTTNAALDISLMPSLGPTLTSSFSLSSQPSAHRSVTASPQFPRQSSAPTSASQWKLQQQLQQPDIGSAMAVPTSALGVLQQSGTSAAAGRKGSRPKTPATPNMGPLPPSISRAVASGRAGSGSGSGSGVSVWSAGSGLGWRELGWREPVVSELPTPDIMQPDPLTVSIGCSRYMCYWLLCATRVQLDLFMCVFVDDVQGQYTIPSLVDLLVDRAYQLLDIIPSYAG